MEHSNTKEDIHQHYSTSNTVVYKFNKYFCSWGTKRPFASISSKQSMYKIGNPPPLFKNQSKSSFLILLIMNIISAIISIVFFGVTFHYQKKNLEEIAINGNPNCFKNLFVLKAEFSLIGIILLIINAIISWFLYNKEYASDQEWSRYTVIYSISWIVVVTYVTFQLHQFASSFIIMQRIIDDAMIDKDCIIMITIHIWMLLGCIIVNLIEIITQIIIIAKNYCKLFTGNSVLCIYTIPYTPCSQLKVFGEK